MNRVVIAAATVSVAAASAAGWAWGPRGLSRIRWFDVQRVEVSGARLLAPHAVLAASGIRSGQSVWDDVSVWEGTLRAHPVIASASVTRRLPGTLRVRIAEKRPVALVEAGSLRPVTESGEVLPIDPAGQPVDLPIVRGEWGDSAGSAAARRLLRIVARIERLQPGLLAEVSEIRADTRDASAVVLGHRLADVVIPDEPGTEELVRLGAVLAELERRGSSGGETRPRVDLRFRDQIVVRLS